MSASGSASESSDTIHVTNNAPPPPLLTRRIVLYYIERAQKLVPGLGVKNIYLSIICKRTVKEHYLAETTSREGGEGGGILIAEGQNSL